MTERVFRTKEAPAGDTAFMAAPTFCADWEGKTTSMISLDRVRILCMPGSGSEINAVFHTRENMRPGWGRMRDGTCPEGNTCFVAQSGRNGDGVPISTGPPTRRRAGTQYAAAFHGCQ